MRFDKRILTNMVLAVLAVCLLLLSPALAQSGEPDKNDWIITCEEQSEIYPLIIETIEHVSSFIE